MLTKRQWTCSNTEKAREPRLSPASDPKRSLSIYDTGKRPACEGCTRVEIGTSADSSIALEPMRDLARIGADPFTQDGHLVRECNGRGEKRVQSVLRHLCGLDLHPLEPVGDRMQQALDHRAVSGRADTDHDPVRAHERVDRFA